MNVINSMIITTLFFYGENVFAGNNNVTTSGTDFDWISTIVLVIGLILLGWYQKYQINILKKELESQRKIISNLEKYTNILDVEKIREFVDISEETIRKKSELERLKFESNINEKIKSVEVEKEKLLSELRDSSETAGKIKSDYEAFVKRSSNKITLAYKYIIITQALQMLSLIQHRLLSYAKLLLLSNKIDTDDFDNYSNEIGKLDSVIYNALNSFRESDMLELEENVKIPKAFSRFDSGKCFGDIKSIGESIQIEVDRILKTVT
jgi:hypothetical protein